MKTRSLSKAALGWALGFAALGAAIGALAAGPKSAGIYTVGDDLPSGSAGSVGASGGSYKVSGSLSQTSVDAASMLSYSLEGGYFSKAVSSPTAPSIGGVFPSSFSYTFNNPGNPAGTDYAVQVSTDNFSTYNVIITTYGSPALINSTTSLTYYVRTVAAYMNGDQSPVSAPVNLPAGGGGATVFAAASNIAPAAMGSTAFDVGLLRIGLWTDTGTGALNSLLVNLIGNTPSGSVMAKLYRDLNGDGVFQSSDTFLTSASFTAGPPAQSTLNFGQQTLTPTTAYFFVAVDYSSVTSGHQFGVLVDVASRFGLTSGVMAPQGPDYPLQSQLVDIQTILFANPSAGGYTVPTSATGGFDTGLFVQGGQQVQVLATGTWSSGQYAPTGPDGTAVFGGLAGGLKFSSLVGRIGGSGWLQLGGNATVVSTFTGQMFLAMNDTSYFDNSGQIAVNLQVLASTVSKVWTGNSGINLNASINSNWLNSQPPGNGDNVRFDGQISTRSCNWDIYSANLGLLTLTTSYAGIVTVAPVSYQLAVSSHVQVFGGILRLGTTANLLVQGQLQVKGGVFDLGPSAGLLEVGKGILLDGGVFNSTGTGQVTVQALNAAERFPVVALAGALNINNLGRTQFIDSSGLQLSTVGATTLNYASFLNTSFNPSPAISFAAAASPRNYSFSELSFDVNTSTNIDAVNLPAGSSVNVYNAGGAHMGSPYHRDPNFALVWSPDGGAFGSASGSISYGGGQGGTYYIMASTRPTGPDGPWMGGLSVITSQGGQGAYSLTSLPTPNTWYFVAWKTVNSSGPIGMDPRGTFGCPGCFGFNAPTYLGAGANATGVNITLQDWARVTGNIVNSSSQQSPVRLRAAVNSSTTTPWGAYTLTLPPGGGPYDLPVPAGSDIQIQAFADVNGNAQQDDFEASGSSGVIALSALSVYSGVSFSVTGGSAAAGGVLSVVATGAHPGYIGSIFYQTLPQAMLKLDVAASGSNVTWNSLGTALTGAAPAGTYSVALWRDDNANGVFDSYNFGAGGAADAQVGYSYISGGVSTHTIALYSPEALAPGTTRTYFVTLDLSGQNLPPVALQIGASTFFNLSQGSMASQTYPMVSSAAAVLRAVPAGVSAQNPASGGQDTGLGIANGQLVTVTATGLWKINASSSSGPGGLLGTTGLGTVVPAAAHGQLIGRVGDDFGNSSPWAPIVSGSSFTSTFGGKLFLAVNDYPGSYFDNTGAVFASLGVSGSTTGALSGTITYKGGVSSGNLVIRAATTDPFCPNCPNRPFNIVSTVTLPMSGGTPAAGVVTYSYGFNGLQPHAAYLVDAFVSASPAQTGGSQTAVPVVVGSTASGVDFALSLGQGSIAGALGYTGVQPTGNFVLAVATVTDFGHDVFFFATYTTNVAGPYSFSGLPSPNTYYIVGFRDVNFDNKPNGAEPFGVVGNSSGAISNLSSLFSAVFVDTGAAVSGKNLTLLDKGAITGNVTAAGASSVNLVVQAGHGLPGVGYQLENRDFRFIGSSGSASQFFQLDLLRPATDYSVFAFLDANGSGAFDPGEAFALAPGPFAISQGGFNSVYLTLSSAAAPSMPLGFSGAAQSSTQVLWSWNSVPGALSYELRNISNGVVTSLSSSTLSYTENVGLPNTLSTIRAVTASNGVGTSPSNFFSPTASFAVAPSSPSFLTVLQSSVSLSWNGNGNSPATQYRVARATAEAGPFQLVIATNTSTAVDAGLTPGGTFFYNVKAVNDNGLESAASSTSSVVTLPATAPSLGGTVSYSGRQSGFFIVQAATTSSFAQISNQVTLPNGAAQSYYLSVAGGVSYYQRAFVDVNGTGVFEPGEDKGLAGPVAVGGGPVVSNFTIAADTVAPANPTGLTATTPLGRVSLAWGYPNVSANGSPLFDLAGFRVQRSTLSAGPFATISTGTVYGTTGTVAGAAFTDFNPVPGQSNFYRIVAVDFGGNQSLPSGLAQVTPFLGASIAGSVQYFGATTAGAFRVRLATAPDAGSFTGESTLNPFSFTALSDGSYFIRVFRDVNGDGAAQDSEPAGTLGGIAQPYPIPIFNGSTVTGSTVTVCDRVQVNFTGGVKTFPATISTAGCPAVDQGPGFFTSLGSFRVGGGSAGSVGVGANLSISMQSSFPNRLLVLGPGGGVIASDARPGGASVNLNNLQAGLYLVEPTSFNPYDGGAATVTLSVAGGFSGMVAGTMSYSGAQAGTVFVQLFNNADAAAFAIVQSSFPLGGYSIGGLPDGVYYLRAFRDVNGNLARDPGEPSGAFGVSASSLTAITLQGGVTFVGGTANSAVSVTLTDPAVGSVAGTIARQGSQTGTIRVEVGTPRCVNCDLNVVAFASIPAAGAYSVPFIAPATNYIVQAYVDVNGNGRLDPLEAKGSASDVTVQADQTAAVNLLVQDPGTGASGNATVQGTISYGGASTGAVLVGFSQDSSFQFIPYVVSQVSTGPYVKSGVVGGTSYYIVAFIDSNGNGQPDDRRGEPAGFYGGTSFDSKTPVFVPGSGAVTANVTLYDAPNGAINGRVTYGGGAPLGQALIVQAYLPGVQGGGSGYQKAVIARQSGVSQYDYSLPFLAAATYYNVSAFIDASGNGQSDFGEPFANFGQTACAGAGACYGASVLVSSGAGTFPTYGVNFSVQDPGNSGGNLAANGSVGGEIFYLGIQGGPIVVRLFTNSSYSGAPLLSQSLTAAAGPGNFPFRFSGLALATTYFVDAFRDTSFTGVFNPTFQAYQRFYGVTPTQAQPDKNVDSGPTMTDPGQGGSVNAYTGSFGAPGGARFDGGATDLGLTVAVDSIAAGGPFIYVAGITAQSIDAVSLVKYSSAGVFLTSTTLPGGNTGTNFLGTINLDTAGGKIYIGGSAHDTGAQVSTPAVVQLDTSLRTLATVKLAGAPFWEGNDVDSLVFFNGYLYAGVRGNQQGGPMIRKIDASSFITVATGTFSFPGAVCTFNCGGTRMNALAVDPNSGAVYAVATFDPGGPGNLAALVRFGPNLDGSGTPLVADITGLNLSPDGHGIALTLDASANLYLGFVRPGQLAPVAATFAKYGPTLQPLASTSYSPIFHHFGAGFGSLKADADGTVYAALQAASNGGDYLALRYDSGLNLLASRTFDGGTNTLEDFAASIAVQDSSNVYVAGAVNNGLNLDWATVRFNMNASGAASGGGTAVVITSANATNAIYGTLAYGGTLVTSGTVRGVLVPLGSNTPVRFSSAAFSAAVPYVFNNVPGGLYQVKSFIDLNANLLPEAGEPVGWSAAAGFQYTPGSSLQLNVGVCDRRAIALNSAVTATITPSDCAAADRGGAFQRLYTFAGNRGQVVTIDLDAVNFYDTYLSLYDPDGDLTASDDESGGGGNASISDFVLPDDGLYTIAASPFAGGLTSATIRLALSGSAGSLGSISGAVAYTGAQGGQIHVALFSSSSFNNSFLEGLPLPSPGPYTFSNLTTGASYFIGAFIDVDGNGEPGGGEDVGVFGSTVTGAAPVFLRAGQNFGGVNLTIQAGFAASASSTSFAVVTGLVNYTGLQTGTLRVQFYPNSSFSGQAVGARTLPGVSGPYDLPLPPGVYYARAFLDVNGDNVLQPNEPDAVYAPRNQGAEAVFAPSSGTVTGVDITLQDPGFVAGASGIAGEGSASITPSTAAAGTQVFTATITYTAGPNGVQAGGRVGFTVPPGFAAAQFVTANSTSAATLSAVNFNGQSAFVNITAGSLLSGQQLNLVYTNGFVACLTSTVSFTVAASQNGTVTPQPLFAGSPTLQVVKGPPAFLQPSNPYFSLKQGVLSDAQSLQARDLCGNVTQVTGAVTATLRAKRFDIATSQFVADATVTLSSSAAATGSGSLSLDFATGRSSAAFFALSSSTGPKNIEVFFNLGAPNTFYYGLSVLPGNILSAVAVSTRSFALGTSSVTIIPNGSGLADVAYVNFTLSDAGQGWHVVISSIPFKATLTPPALWETWGFGQPGLGQIAWDGRFSPWLNGGVRVPSGLYYVRVEIGGSGVRDDSLQINVNAPQFAGRVFDAGVTPNPPLSGARVQVYGPSGSLNAQSDAQGRFVLPGIAAGTYNVFLTRPDYLDGSLTVTVDAAGAVSTFTALTSAVSGAINASSGLDLKMGRSSILLVVPSLGAGFSTQSFVQWGGLQVRPASTSSAQQPIFGPLRLAAGTTTFDDGGQWDPGSQSFIARTLLKFNVAVGTYTAEASFGGFAVSSASVYVGQGVTTLNLPAFARKSTIAGLVSVPANADGIFVSVNAIPSSSSTLVSGGFGGVFLPAGQLSGTYTVVNLDAGSYLLRANTQGFAVVSTGPILVPASSDVTGVHFPAFNNGASINGTVTVNANTTGRAIGLSVNAWAPGSQNFGSTVVYVTGGASGLAIPYIITGLDAGATYQIYANLVGVEDLDLNVAQGQPLLKPAPGVLNFTFNASSGVIAGTILLPPGSNDFHNVSLFGQTVASARPENVGHQFSVASSTGLPNFACSANGLGAPTGFCPAGNSSATFTVQGLNTETDDITLFYRTTGQTKTIRVSVSNGSTATITVDLRPQTFSISGQINNLVTNALFNTNPNVVANAPYITPPGYPAGLSSSTARVNAILQDISQFKVAISTTFNPATTRVGFLTAAGTYTITGLPAGVYFVRTVDLRACATCPILVPSVGQIVNVAGVSVSSVNFTLTDGFSVAGSVSLDGGLQDAQVFTLSVLNRRQEVVRSTAVYLGDSNLGLTANAVSFVFNNLPANDFYTLSAVSLDGKYAGAPIQFPDPSLSPSGLQSNLIGQSLLMKRAAFFTGKLKDANTGELINASNAGLLAPNFQISATANPWTLGGFAVAASSVAGRPIQADGTFRVGPLLPSVAYNVKLAQTSWDPAFLSRGSQNYAPVSIAGSALQPGEVRDLGVISLNQGQSLTGTVRQSTTTGALLGNIKITAQPSFAVSDLRVQTYTNPQGQYTLWVSSFISNQYDVTAAPRDGNVASNGSVYAQVVRRNVSLLATTTADFLLEPLLASVTGQVIVADAATGGRLSYPFGENKGFPAAAINLQPKGVIPTKNPLGDIEATTDQEGRFSILGLSTGTYLLKATSLGYAVFNATVTASTSTFVIYTGSNTAANYLANNTLTLSRGASVTGRILKSDGSAPNDGEVGGVAAANFSKGEFVIGTVDLDKTAKTVNSYTISGFKPDVAYSIVILPAVKGDDLISPPEGANITFTAAESTTTKNINLTYLTAAIDCNADAKALGNSQFQLKIDCTQDLRNQTAADKDLDQILSVSTKTSGGVALVSPNGTGQFLGSDKSLSNNRKQITAIYRAAAGETAFSVRLKASASAINAKTGANFAIDRIFDFYAGLDSNVTERVNNINGGSVQLTPSAEDEQLGADERTRVDLAPGTFAVGYDTDTVTGVAEATTTVAVGLSKAKDKNTLSALYMRQLGFVPTSVADRRLSALPAELGAAMVALAGSTPTVNGVNPLSSFYNIFLPAGIRHQLKQNADLTFSYDTRLSTSGNPDNFNVWFFNAVLGKYVKETTNRRIDTVNKTITVAVNHFSVFLVLDGAPILAGAALVATERILVANFPNPSDCRVHSGIVKNAALGLGGGNHADFYGTMIRYILPAGPLAQTKIRIYSLNGELVRVLDQGQVTGSSTNYFPWDCANASGRQVASGVYIGEVEWGGKRAFVKIAIVKGSGL